MKPLYTATLSNANYLIYIISIIFVLVCSLFLIPNLPRSLDRGNGHPLAKIMVFAFFGSGFIRAGGIPYRLSAYENKLVVCFVGAKSYLYKDVKLLKPFAYGNNNLKISLNGITVNLYGNSESLRHFSEVISKYVM